MNRNTQNKIIFLGIFLALTLLIVGCSKEKREEAKKAKIRETECLTQTNFAASFIKLKKAISETGVHEKSYDGYERVLLNKEGIELSLRITGTTEGELEEITIYEKETSTFYWLLFQNSKFTLETKDFAKETGEAKRIEAEKHFCDKVVKLF